MGEFAGLVILGAIALWLYRVGVRGGKTAD
jgi:hypothetical protein